MSSFDGGFHNPLNVLAQLFWIMVSIAVKRDKMRHVTECEPANHLVSDLDGGVHQSIEIGREKTICPPGQGVEPGRDLCPARMRVDVHSVRVFRVTIDIHEDAGAVDIAVAVIQKTRPHRLLVSVNPVFHLDYAISPGMHSPGVLVYFFPIQLISGFIRGREIPDVAGELPDEIGSRCPYRHD